jgi:flagellar hook-associated protein 3 FlgL
MVRVSDASNYDRVLGTLTKGKMKLEKLQTEGATMKRLQAPSDDPVSAQTVLSVRTEIQNNQQFEAACRKAQGLLLDFDTAVEELAETVIRARDLVLAASSDASSSDQTRQGTAEEIQQLSLLALSIANRQVGQRYIFMWVMKEK